MRDDETARQNGAHFALFLEDEGTGREMVIWLNYTFPLDDNQFLGVRSIPVVPLGLAKTIDALSLSGSFFVLRKVGSLLKTAIESAQKRVSRRTKGRR
jgi:hypothetical protein